jgi:hypothetical protein
VGAVPAQGSRIPTVERGSILVSPPSMDLLALLVLPFYI